MNTNTQTSILVIKKNMCKKTKGKFMKQNYKLSNKYGLLTYRTQKKKKNYYDYMKYLEIIIFNVLKLQRHRSIIWFKNNHIIQIWQ